MVVYSNIKADQRDLYNPNSPLRLRDIFVFRRIDLVGLDSFSPKVEAKKCLPIFFPHSGYPYYEKIAIYTFLITHRICTRFAPVYSDI